MVEVPSLLGLVVPIVSAVVVSLAFGVLLGVVTGPRLTEWARRALDRWR